MPFGAHPQGFAMSNVIVDQLGRDRLIGTVDNPFSFVKLYNEAAGFAGRYVLSEAAMRVLDGLEARWVPPAAKAERDSPVPTFTTLRPAI